MLNFNSDYNKHLITASRKFSTKSKNVDINRLLNRIKKNVAAERKKKIILLSLTIAPILVTGLIIF
jgi:hypothetical protein